MICKNCLLIWSLKLNIGYITSRLKVEHYPQVWNTLKWHFISNNIFQKIEHCWTISNMIFLCWGAVSLSGGVVGPARTGQSRAATITERRKERLALGAPGGRIYIFSQYLVHQLIISYSSSFLRHSIANIITNINKGKTGKILYTIILFWILFRAGEKQKT